MKQHVIPSKHQPIYRRPSLVPYLEAESEAEEAEEHVRGKAQGHVAVQVRDDGVDDAGHGLQHGQYCHNTSHGAEAEPRGERCRAGGRQEGR